MTLSRRVPSAIEREAEETARLALRARAPRPRPPRQASEVGHAVPDGVRAELEDRFGVDLTMVRVRAGDERVARRGARAETRGGLMSFAPGEFVPSTATGLALIAHELAHLTAQQPGSADVVRSQKNTAAKPFHQEVIDRYNAEWFGPNKAAIRPILSLCDAVDAERTADIGALVSALAKLDAYALPPDFPSAAVAEELMARLVLVGLAPAAAQVRAWYVELPGVRGPGRGQPNRRYYDDEEWYWQQVLARLRGKVDWEDGKATLRALDGLASFFHLLEAERAALDPKQLEADRARVIDLAKSLGGLGFGMESRPYLSISRYASSLVGMMRDAFVGIQAAFQAVMEQATAALGARKDRTLLDALEQRLSSVLAKLVFPEAVSFEINEWQWRKARGKDVLRQVDFFPDDKRAAKRAITLESYDAEAGGFDVPSKQLDSRRIVAIRTLQVGALKRLFGLETEAGKQTADAKENEAALSATGSAGLHRHSDEDWRKFLLAKFEAHFATSKSAEESLDSVIELLRLYLRAFTTHSPLNIDDFGDDLLRLDFPRTLTGQLVHDCGVYALRIAYMLSLLREHPALKLRFRYVQLPVHIGLIITGDKLPTYIVHNDDFQKHDAAEVARLRARWARFDANGVERPAPPPGATPKPLNAADEQQFLGELAADAFVAATDMPFVISEVPKLGGKNERVDKTALWAFYRSLVGKKLFGPVTENPKKEEYQFHLRYLAVLEAIKAHHNTWLVPYWDSIAHVSWQQHKAALEQADTALKAASTPAATGAARAQFSAVAARYLKDAVPGFNEGVESGYLKVLEAQLPIRDLSNKISDAIANRPEVIARGVSRASAARLVEVLGSDTPWWARDISSHLTDIRGQTLAPPPFAEKKDLLFVVD